MNHLTDLPPLQEKFKDFYSETQWSNMLERNKRERAMIAEMRSAGCEVLLEPNRGTALVIKVRRPGHRQIRKASTSWYPVQAVYEEWRSQTTPIGIVRFHIHGNQEAVGELLLPSGRLAESGRQIIGFKSRIGDPWIDLTAPDRSIRELVGMREIYLVTGNPMTARTILPCVRVIEEAS